MDGALFVARKLLSAVTPLKGDCGRICGSACCASLEGEETGMLLFPGEERFYADRSEWRIRRTETGENLLICPGRCNRAERPLSCRLFPLLPEVTEAGVRVWMDARAGAVCPLVRMGKQALNPAFTEAVREAGEALIAAEEQRAFLCRLTREQRELRALKAQFGG